MTQVADLGTKNDMDRRTRNARKDTERRQEDVENTRHFMFSRGDGPTAKSVEDVLSKDSRVPTRVCSQTTLLHPIDIIPIRTRSHFAFVVFSTTIKCWS